MHSTLQAEVRLTQRFVKSSCHHCTRRCESPRRLFHYCRDLRSSQGARNNASSQPTSTPVENDKNLENKPEVASTPPPSGYALPASIAKHFLNRGGPSPDDAEQPPASAFYGSSANRKLRSRGPKELPEPVAVAPEWFRENNVTLFTEGKPSSIEETGEIPGVGVQNSSLQESSPSGDSSAGPDASHMRAALDETSAQNEGNVKSRLVAFGASQEAHDLRRGDDKPSRYFVHQSQDAEIMHTVRGLINAPERRDFQDEPALRTTHLILHYPDQKGESLLDEYVRNVATRLHCDLVTLDAQDIADLICIANKGRDITESGRMLSYEVLHERRVRQSEAEADKVMFGPGGDPTNEEMDEEDDNDPTEIAPPRNSMGMPLLLGKPITIDLSNIFGGPGGRRGSTKPNSPLLPSRFLSDMFNPSNQSSRSPTEPFTNMVEAVLSVLPNKRIHRAKSQSEKSASSTSGKIANDRTIIHVKDPKAIQDIKIGNHFMQELYTQAEKRRDNGENIMLIGTECQKHEFMGSSDWKIDKLQQAKSDEISRTIVVTPAFPKPTWKMVLMRDHRRRTATINLRHIWEMMRFKAKDNFLDLQPGFWNHNIYERLTTQDRGILEHEIWSFSHIHRICSYISGIAQPLPNSPSELFPESWPEDKIMPLISGVSTILGDSDRTKAKWAEKEAERNLNIMTAKVAENPRLLDIKMTATKHEKRLMSGILESDKLKTTFEDVHAPKETIDALQTLTMLSLIRPEAFSYGVLASDKIPGLLLYGPPGTGKTLLAKAVAKESGATMLEVSAAEINDMFVGEGEKNVKALFSLAKKLSPCVVFLDEADAMFSARSNSGRRVSHRELLNQFLKEWDGMSNDSGSAFIMVATNRPMDLDDAVLRRLPRRLLVDLPAESDRLEILKIHLRNEQLAEDVDLADLAKKTPFYSGSDLKNVAVTAAMNAVREETEASTKHTGEEPYQYPKKRTLTKVHFEKALEEISASISEDMSSLRDIKKFDEQYGDKRGKRRKGPKWGFRTAKEADKVLDTVKVRN
jgi:ATP-dependent 26S proteasome regulatory subunit